VTLPASRRRAALVLPLLALLAGAPAAAQDVPLLVVLSDTGEVRDGLNVFCPHPDASRISAELLRGFPERMARLYRLEQEYLHRKAGTPIEPAYLEFSRRQGGFPGFGFWLGAEAKRGVGYVDLYEDQFRRPRFGGIDQIFPHELAHVMVQQLAGEPAQGGSTQGHAIAVRTDPVMAFTEGFAEHFQVMALDDPEADPRARALLSDPYWQAHANRDVEEYRRAMTARWAPASRARIAFMFWYSGTEQVLRYYGVRSNAFARQPAVPERLLRTTDPYAAYLLENVLPGAPTDPPKSAAQMLATEGVVSTLFWKWATCEALRSRYADEAFYARFGVARQDVPPELNVYLKLFDVLHTSRPQTAQGVIEAYTAAFPRDAADVDAVVREVLLGQALPRAPELWLANRDFHVGTRIFDQLRAAPQTHTFDLNAASVTDLVAVPGVSLELAREILRHGPYDGTADLGRVPGLSPALVQRFAAMSADIKAVRAADGGSSSLFDLVWAFGRRALLLWGLAAAVGAVLFRRVRRCGWVRAGASALGASLAVFGVAWVIGSFRMAAAAPLVAFAVPGLVWSLRQRPLGPALARTALAWVLAAAPALTMITPLL
jgi:DNA uptake protein ComE-like DNA-binding protein